MVGALLGVVVWVGDLPRTGSSNYHKVPRFRAVEQHTGRNRCTHSTAKSNRESGPCTTHSPEYTLRWVGLWWWCYSRR